MKVHRLTLLINITRVNTLVWDDDREILYIGGKFDMLDGNCITSGLASWSKSTGLTKFEGGGIENDKLTSSVAEVTTMAYDMATQVEYVISSLTSLL